MNASSHSGSDKRPILDAFDAALGVSDVRFASFGAGLFGVSGAGKIRSFAAKQSSSLFCFGFFGRYFPQAGLTNSFSGIFGSDILARCSQQIGMSLHKMFFLAKTFEVTQVVVGFIVIYMMDLFGWVKINHPTFCHNTVHKVFASQHMVPVFSGARGVWAQLSKNFSAARNSVKMVKESVFDSVNYYVGHVVPFEVFMGNQVLT